MQKTLISAAILALFGSVSAGCEMGHIIGATFGPAEVTAQISHAYNLGHKDFEATTDQFFDSYPKHTKTLTITYDLCGNVATVVALEGDSINLP